MMTTRIKRCLSAACKQARKGKRSINFTVHKADVEVLEEEGFGLELPKQFNVLSPKALVEVHISWEKATTGIAKKCKTLTEKYCRGMNSCSRKHIVLASRESVKDSRKQLAEEYDAILADDDSVPEEDSSEEADFDFEEDMLLEEDTDVE